MLGLGEMTSHWDVWAAGMSRAPGRFGLHREGGMRHGELKATALPAKGESRGAGSEREKESRRAQRRKRDRAVKKKGEKKTFGFTHTHKEGLVSVLAAEDNEHYDNM